MSVAKSDEESMRSIHGPEDSIATRHRHISGASQGGTVKSFVAHRDAIASTT